MKRVVALGDLHCGHRAGLTPPEWQWPIRGGTKERNRWGKVQRELWTEYMKIVEEIKPPVDVLIANGDLIDGRGEASGGLELITANRIRQAEMAYDALSVWEARKVVVTIGTPYHVGQYERLERELAKDLGGEAYNHAFVDVDGVVFDCKHKIGRSTIPHGRGTPIARDRLWNVLRADRDEEPRADVVLRSHVHYFRYAGEVDWLAMILPALQAATEYGERACTGTVDWGVVSFEVENGGYQWRAHVKPLDANKARIVRVR